MQLLSLASYNTLKTWNHHISVLVNIPSCQTRSHIVVKFNYCNRAVKSRLSNRTITCRCNNRYSTAVALLEIMCEKVIKQGWQREKRDCNLCYYQGICWPLPPGWLTSVFLLMIPGISGLISSKRWSSSFISTIC